MLGNDLIEDAVALLGDVRLIRCVPSPNLCQQLRDTDELCLPGRPQLNTQDEGEAKLMETNGGPGRIRTYDQRIMSPLL
jgi:hypothetical protein